MGNYRYVSAFYSLKSKHNFLKRLKLINYINNINNRKVTSKENIMCGFNLCFDLFMKRFIK